MRAVALGLTTLAIGTLALAVLGTLCPGLPLASVVTAFVPPLMSWVFLGALACGAVAGYLWWRKRGRYPAALAVLAVLVLVGATVVTARMTLAVERAGVDVDLLDTLRSWTDVTAVPDAKATYTTYDGEPLDVSIYRPAPARPDARAPVLVFVHGGGWVAGDRDAHAADSRWFADRGWLVITVDYPLSSADRHTWDVAQRSVGCALGWVNANAANYGGDPARLSLSGDSAGGNLAINAAYLASAGKLESSCGGTAPKVSAVTTLYPVVDPADFYLNPDPALGGTSRSMAAAYTGGTPQQFPERYAAIASATYLHPAAPPTLILLGGADHLVPVGATHRFVDAARAMGVDVELVSVPYADHVFDARPGSIGQQAFRQLTAKWLDQHGQAP